MTSKTQMTWVEIEIARLLLEYAIEYLTRENQSLYSEESKRNKITESSIEPKVSGHIEQRRTS